MYSHLDSVCMDIKTTTKDFGGGISWIFGSCSSSVYLAYQQYTEQCCQEKGDYKVVCKADHGMGWRGGYVQIGDIKYCDDFNYGLEVVHEIKKFKGE